MALTCQDWARSALPDTRRCLDRPRRRSQKHCGEKIGIALVNHTATAQQQAYIFLQDQIVSGALAGGSRLHLETISHKLGISRMPIREAIRQLDAEGYVTIRPNRGAVVTSRTPEQVVELFEIRAALEGLAMRLSIPHVTEDAIEDLKLELARLRRLE